MTIAYRGASLAAILLLFASSITGQKINLSGKVTSKTGRTISNALVMLASDTAIATITDSLGRFLLKGELVAMVRKRVAPSYPLIFFQGGRLRVVATKPSAGAVAVFSTSGRRIVDYRFFIPTPGTHLVTFPAHRQSSAAYYLARIDIAGNQTVCGYFSPMPSAVSFAPGVQADGRGQRHAAAAVALIVDDTIIVRAKGYQTGICPIASYERADIDVVLEPVSRLGNITRSCEGLMPPAVTSGQKGWGSRYWDCCKPHCSWPDKTKNYVANCGRDGINEIPCFKEVGNEFSKWLEGTKSGCEQDGIAYACYRHVPFAVCEKLAYGFAAVPAGGDACGKCFQLTFDGGASNNDVKAAHKMMKGKIMIVIASNIGHDVSGGQFDLMIPGGGLGSFREGCRKQWNVDVNDENVVGKGLGGLISKCQERLGWDADPEHLKECVRGMCDNLFGKDPAMHDLWEGCIWYVDWMHAVDNPTFTYKEVACPPELLDLYYSSEHPRP